MSINFYKVLHLLGIFMLLTSMGTLSLHFLLGESRNSPRYKWIAKIHGVSLLLILVAGFGMLAKYQMMGVWPGWVIAKILVWIAFALLMAPFKRGITFGKVLSWGAPLLAVISGYFAVYKPF